MPNNTGSHCHEPSHNRPPDREAVNFSNIAVGANTGSLSIAAFRTPAEITGLPRITGGQFMSDTAALDETGLTGITARQWRIKGGMNLGTAPTQMLMAAMMPGVEVECAVTCDQGVLVTPSIHVYMGHNPMHDADDAALLAVVPHVEATHIAVATGAWSAPGTWLNGLVPGHGARVLIQHGVTVTYDFEKRGLRLDWLRVDGELKWRRAGSTYLLVETIVVTQGGLFEVGRAGERIGNGTIHEILFSDPDYRTAGETPTDIDLGRDTKLMSRGLVAQGEYRVWAASKTNWLSARRDRPRWPVSSRVTLAEVPVNWQVGDRIVIGGTNWGIDVNQRKPVRGTGHHRHQRQRGDLRHGAGL